MNEDMEKMLQEAPAPTLTLEPFAEEKEEPAVVEKEEAVTADKRRPPGAAAAAPGGRRSFRRSGGALSLAGRMRLGFLRLL